MDNLKVGDFELVNAEKVERALTGSVSGNGTKVGGVVKEDGSYDDAALLAEYDKLGGLIKKGGDRVVMGSFYDFKNKRPQKDPKVKFVYYVNNTFVEVEEGSELPGIVKAVKVLEKAKEKKPKKK